MRIVDYEAAKALKDVAISLTRDEAEDLALYLSAMLKRPQLDAVHLTEFAGGHLDKEIRIDLVGG